MRVCLASETKEIFLEFMPVMHYGAVDVLVFVNDGDYDKTEECICITVKYKDKK